MPSLRNVVLMTALGTRRGRLFGDGGRRAADQKALADRVEQLAGQVTRDPAGDIIAIDLENRPATEDDLKLLAAAPNLQKLDRLGSRNHRCRPRPLVAVQQAKIWNCKTLKLPTPDWQSWPRSKSSSHSICNAARASPTMAWPASPNCPSWPISRCCTPRSATTVLPTFPNLKNCGCSTCVAA